jgi:hypothetical protein
MVAMTRPTTWLAVLLAGAVASGRAAAQTECGAPAPAAPRLDLRGGDLAWRGYHVLADSAQLGALWGALWQRAAPAAAAPPVDFGAHRVLVLSLGPVPTTGYEVGLDSLYAAGDTLVAVVWEHAPGAAGGCLRSRAPSCWVGYAVRHPTAAYLIPRSPTAIRFRVVQTHGCRAT